MRSILAAGALSLSLTNCEDTKVQRDQSRDSSETIILFSKDVSENLDSTENSAVMGNFPRLLIDGEMKMVPVKDYIAAKLKGVETKYHAIAVPDG